MTRTRTHSAGATIGLRVEPVTKASWDDFAAFFSSKGAPHYCWCSAYRVKNAGDLDNDDKRRALHALVVDSTPVGVIARRGEDVVGWCSVAPRETYVKLERSRTMPRVASAPPATTWTVLCFFVPRAHRGSGVSRALVDGAIAYAKTSGATVVEAYPHDTAGTSATHRGHSSVFKAAGFTRDGKRWSLVP